MKLELWNTLATVGTFVVILATAVAASIQLRHMRRNNELAAVLALRSEITPLLGEAFEFVSTELPAKLQDPQYRAELQNNFAPSRRAHKELVLADYFEHIGTYVKRKLIDENVYFEIASPGRYWALVEPAIAIYRRQRGPLAYENFEYLVLRERAWDKAHPGGGLPKGTVRLVLADPYLEADGSAAGPPARG